MRRLEQQAQDPVRSVTLELEGRAIPAREGEPVACSLWAAGEKVFSRSVKYHRPRGPFCMAAGCSHCLMRVDGVPNLFTCQTPARDGMRLERQNAYPTADVDVFAAIDWLFPRGLDHHEMLAGVPVAEKVMAKVARQLAGTGLLPETPAPPRPEAEVVRTRVAVVGAGVSGMAAAEVLARRGVPFVLVEQAAAPGGRSGAPGVAAAGSSLRTRTTALGLYEDGRGRFVLARAHTKDGPRLLLLFADRFLLCMGGRHGLLPFENNDLPGVFTAQAARAMVRHGVAPGERVALFSAGPELLELSAQFQAHGLRVAAAVELSAGRDPELKAHGVSEVSSVTFREGRRRHRVRCDAVVVGLPPSPIFELARQGGAAVRFDEVHGVFVVEADDAGRTRAPALHVAGSLCGPLSTVDSASSGRRAAEALAGELS